MNTKSNPACYHGALDYFSKSTGIPKSKDIYFDKPEYLRSTPHKNRQNKNSFKTKLLYRAVDIRIETECGKTVMYFPLPNKRFDEFGYVAKRCIVEVNRKLDEFGVQFQPAGNYIDCLGGGWTQKVSLYKHNDFYFAPERDCAHR